MNTCRYKAVSLSASKVPQRYKRLLDGRMSDRYTGHPLHHKSEYQLMLRKSPHLHNFGLIFGKNICAGIHLVSENDISQLWVHSKHTVVLCQFFGKWQNSHAYITVAINSHDTPDSAETASLEYILCVAPGRWRNGTTIDVFWMSTLHASLEVQLLTSFIFFVQRAIIL